MSTKRPPRAIVLLGAQRFDPTLGDAVRELGVTGRVASVTAGWQERELEDQDLDEHLEGRTTNLRLHQRADEVFAEDPELHAAHRDKQAVLRHKQDFYRIRLEHELEAHHTVFQRKAPARILEEERAASLAAIRALDDYHLAQCERVHREFEEALKPAGRPAIARHRDELAAILRDAEALAIAGGHVATLMNRLRLFDIDEMLDGHVVFAWCAGAMAVSERVVLYHDNPPQGPGIAEVFDRGLSLCRDVIPLPQPEARLKMDDAERVTVMTRRFAPARCIALAARTRITFKGETIERSVGPIQLFEDGSHAPLLAVGQTAPEQPPAPPRPSRVTLP